MIANEEGELFLLREKPRAESRPDHRKPTLILIARSAFFVLKPLQYLTFPILWGTGISCPARYVDASDISLWYRFFLLEVGRKKKMGVTLFLFVPDLSIVPPVFIKKTDL